MSEIVNVEEDGTLTLPDWAVTRLRARPGDLLHVVVRDDGSIVLGPVVKSIEEKK